VWTDVTGLRVAVVGGGPGGLYFASLLKRLDPEHEVTVWERGLPGQTYGFGVVFSDLALADVEAIDPVLHDSLTGEAVHWQDIDVHYRGTTVVSGGHGFAALPRRRLLELLRERCAALGVLTRFGEEAPEPSELDGYDVVVAADGAGSATRARLAEAMRPTVEDRRCAYLWLAAERALTSFEFHIVETEWGVFQLHCYPHTPEQSTVIVEARESVWDAAGLLGRRPSTERLQELFAPALGGARLVAGEARRQVFRKVTNERWWHGNTVLLGDAAHTAHFSIGSGTKLALEDAAVLAHCLDGAADVPAAFQAYEEARRPAVESTQRAAQASLEWFEDLEQYLGQEPVQFAFNLLTRSRRVTYDNLRLRDPEFAAGVHAWYERHAVGRPRSVAPDPDRPPMFLPIELRDVVLSNRVMLSPMAMYSATDGLIDDFHLVHLGSKALGGAGLVMTEMVGVSPEGRITPGCAGLYTEEHERAYRRLVDFVHRHTPAKVGIQLGHSGRKGATRVMWEGMDQPLETGDWPLLAPSALPYLDVSREPVEMTRADMDMVVEQFRSATAAAARAGFDLLELHCAHGYLLSGFLTPISNRRTDAYGGSARARLRFPLEVFDAVRETWPSGRPISVRISATDWVEGGIDADDAVDIARAFMLHGADAIDVSTGQTSPDARPRFGRGFQVPFADRIRNTLGVPTIAVGAISSYDDVNSLLLAGRADICAVGRTFLHDPAWPLHAAADQGYRGADWPLQFEPGRRPPPAARPQRGANFGPAPTRPVGVTFPRLPDGTDPSSPDRLIRHA
jgi:anthraniloyl-CoA monooxygenase